MSEALEDWKAYAEKLESAIADNAKAYEELKARLRAYEEGIKPEDAKPAVTYYIKYNGNWQAARTAKGNIYTFDETDRAEVQIYPSRLYPLPLQKGS